MVEQFQAVGLDVHTTPDINIVIWKKLIANVSTNVVAALTGLTGGTAVKHEPSVKIIEALSQELAQVARAKGIDFPELDDPLDFSLKAFASTKDNRVSMLQDVEAGRPTEIGNLNEVIISEAEQTMAAVANSLGHVGLPLNCDVQFLNAADPTKDVIASARVIDTQGRIARVQVELTQENQTVAEVSEMVFLRQQ